LEPVESALHSRPRGLTDRPRCGG